MSYLLRLHALGGVEPYDTIIGSLEFCPLDEIQPGKNHGSQRGER
jgi:hypothetical protein